MDHFIDHLSKKLANAISRREMLSITSKTVISTFMVSTAGRLWGQASTTAPTCPECGTCQRCNVNSGKCGYNCERCAAAELCYEAQQFPTYGTLQNFLVQQQFNVGVPNALEVINSDDTISSVLTTNYIGKSPNQTALLAFTKSSRGLNAYAIQYLNGSAQFGYFVSPDGQVNQILPPSVGASNLAAVSKNGGESTCETWCHLVCENVTETATECLELVIENCELSGPYYFACALVGGAICTAGAGAACGVFCAGFTSAWSAQSDTCPPPFVPQQTCPMANNTNLSSATLASCPSAYTCSSTLGSCTCDNLCGSTCCSAGQMCQNGQCVDNCGCGPGYECFPPSSGCYPTCAICTSENPVCCTAPTVGGPAGSQVVACYTSGYACCGNTGYACSAARGETCCYNQNGGFQACVGAGGTC